MTTTPSKSSAAATSTARHSALASPPAVPAHATEDTQIVFGDGILSALGVRMKEAGLAGRAFVITDDRVGSRYAGRTLEALDSAGFRPELVSVAGGETAKSLQTAAELYSWLADQRAERRDVVVALGGGVMGDLAGFVAATYLRGLALVQVPTTVLAQVDSSVGGKTAINLPQGKNLVGAFHPATLTLIDIAFLDELPPRELSAGWAEVIKTAVIFDPPLFEELERTMPQEMDRGQLLDVISRCVQWKMKIVAEDPTEKGPRMLLNFGHTIGHAIEAATGYGQYLHGEAVAIGMAGVTELSRRLGLVDGALVERIETCVKRADLPVRYEGRLVSPEQLLRAAAADKKAQAARLRWVLTTGLGSTTISSDVPEPLVLDVLRDLAVA
ncbi:MAG: 3-dehydroquinate synthase [uncultured Chloroflexi bacterium]|uniref:3-dehydroquinate synthase n=1 Tax=uncultured Chloroflexota bacterium TaxID=166587 RepID=A0A6J4IG70_9CHLR|nr:MAG: 3-dehydroquinate synthase [uncultured Chloroflexota bacterium]